MALLKGWTIRPTPDHVREALFSILGQDLTDWIVLDLFAGSGVLSLEAVSRGGRFAVLADRSPLAVKLMRRNAAILGVSDLLQIRRIDLRRGLSPLESLGMVFDLVFLDPPYDQGMIGPTLQRLDSSLILSSSSVIVIEHSRGESLGCSFHRLFRVDERRYGQTCLSFFKVT